jgi:hypothetical protein
MVESTVVVCECAERRLIMTSSLSAAPLLMALLAFSFTPTVAHAQEVVASSLRELATSLKTNEQLIVTDRDGHPSPEGSWK